jgi:ABC-type sugar transport system permease subunit
MAIGATEPLARERFDATKLLVVPAAVFMLLLFIYPFLYGLWLSFVPKEGGALGNYRISSRPTISIRRSGRRFGSRCPPR